MVEWSAQLYLNDVAVKKIKKIKNSIDKCEFLFETYCITLASNEENLFDIMNVNELMFPYYRRKKIKILGLASSREFAKELVVEMVMEMYKDTNDFKVKEYFK